MLAEASRKHPGNRRSNPGFHQPAEGAGAGELHPVRVEVDPDWPDGGIAHLNMAGDEHVDLGRRQHQGVLAGAEPRLPEKELRQDALNAKACLGIRSERLGRLRPG
jgi:hypothetical protein